MIDGGKIQAAESLDAVLMLQAVESGKNGQVFVGALHQVVMPSDIEQGHQGI